VNHAAINSCLAILVSVMYDSYNFYCQFKKTTLKNNMLSVSQQVYIPITN